MNALPSLGGGSSEPMRLLWIVEGLQGSTERGFNSELASNRYRVLIPAQALSERGYQIEFLTPESWTWSNQNHPDVVIIGKLLAGSKLDNYHAKISHVVTQMGAAARAGIPVLVDFNDDHFDHPVMGGAWRRLASAATVCVAGTQAMERIVRLHTPRPVTVVGDPVGTTVGMPRAFNPSKGIRRKLGAFLSKGSQERLKFVWYGNPTNWEPLKQWLTELAPLKEQQPWLIWLVTRPTAEIQTFLDKFNAEHAPAALAELIEWDEQAQWDVVRDSDIVLIPSTVDDPKKSVKTSNRLVDALAAGRCVVASPLPSYLPFEDYAILTERPIDAVRTILDNPVGALSKINRGQGAIQALCGAGVIASQWDKAIRGAVPLVESAVSVPAEPVTAPVRLNLGCGDKILPGYVNVDVVASRAGKLPDVLCDLHDLSVFPDNHADEVMAIHVVEHFWRWEVEDILREWIRVLKPGGKMILECPNLVSACEEFLKDPERYSSEGKDGQRTMWVFYGDPAWKDPYMIHRWGYTPSSLQTLLESVGLSSVCQEPAQYKLREPRDMRIVGVKPATPIV